MTIPIGTHCIIVSGDMFVGCYCTVMRYTRHSEIVRDSIGVRFHARLGQYVIDIPAANKERLFYAERPDLLPIDPDKTVVRERELEEA